MYNRKLFESTKEEKYIEPIIKWLGISNSTCWEPSLHVFWSVPGKDKNGTVLICKSDFQNVVQVLLFISKFRKDSKVTFVKDVLIKGITLEIIKFFCQISQKK